MKQQNKEIGSLLKQARTKIKKTQYEIAEYLGYSTPQFIHLIENGKSKIPAKILGKLSNLFPKEAEKMKKIMILQAASEIQKDFDFGRTND